MSLFDEFKAESKPRQYKCIVNSIFESLDENESADLQAALDDPSITNSAIARVLAARGFPVTPEGKQIARHRKGDCVCAR